MTKVNSQKTPSDSTATIAVKGDVDAAAKCEKRLLELKPKLDEVIDALEWPTLVAEANDWLQ